MQRVGGKIEDRAREKCQNVLVFYSVQSRPLHIPACHNDVPTVLKFRSGD